MTVALRLFDPDDFELAEPDSPASPPSRPISLRKSFEELLRPELYDRQPVTIAEYELHIRRWEELMESPENRNPRITYPGVSIGKRSLLCFRQKLIDQREPDGSRTYSNRTINKHLGSILAILRVLHDEGEIPRLPKIRALPCRDAADKLYFTYDELSALYESCRVAKWPDRLHVPAPLFWRAALVIWFNYGLRTQELIKYHSRMRSLSWSNISWEEQSPARGSKATNRFGWLSYVPKKQERLKPQPLHLPLNETSYVHLKSLVPSHGCIPVELIFPFPLTKKSFFGTWGMICQTAGIKPVETANQEDYLIKHLRKTCTTWHNFHACPWEVAELITGHAARKEEDSPSRVLLHHYDNQELRLRDHILNFPQPDAFVRGAKSLLQ